LEYKTIAHSNKNFKERYNSTLHIQEMTQVQFEEIPVEEEFCVLVGSKQKHDATL
jgi:hypothetical protein